MPAIAILRRTLDHSQDDTRLVEAWRELLDRHARTTSALERSLHEHGLGVSEYEVLERLATGEKDERRMQDLAEAVHLSQSALSRVVARLEADGLVMRACAPRTAAASSPASPTPAASATPRPAPRTARCWRRRSTPEPTTRAGARRSAPGLDGVRSRW